jgi:phage tail-like protein
VPGPNATNNYIGSFHFKVSVEGFETQLDGFTSCSGVKSLTEVYDFKHGFDTHVRKAIGRTSYEPVVLERAYSGLDEFALWRDRIEAGAQERKYVIIEYLTANHKLVSRFRLQNAFPSRWESPDLNAMGSDAAIERIELTYERVVREVSGEHLLDPTWWAPSEETASRKPAEPWWVRKRGPDHKVTPPPTRDWVLNQKPPEYKRRKMDYPDWVFKY